jgi:hypothetical protein
MVVLGGRAVSYELGTPVALCQLLLPGRDVRDMREVVLASDTPLQGCISTVALSAKSRCCLLHSAQTGRPAQVDVGKVGRISKQQFEAILLKRAYDARTSESLEYQIGGILDKSYAYKSKALVADRSLVRSATLMAFAVADTSNSGTVDFEGFVKWQQPNCAKRAGPSTKLSPPVQCRPLRSPSSVSVYGHTNLVRTRFVLRQSRWICTADPVSNLISIISSCIRHTSTGVYIHCCFVSKIKMLPAAFGPNWAPRTGSSGTKQKPPRVGSGAARRPSQEKASLPAEDQSLPGRRPYRQRASLPSEEKPPLGATLPRSPSA